MRLRYVIYAMALAVALLAAWRDYQSIPAADDPGRPAFVNEDWSVDWEKFDAWNEAENRAADRRAGRTPQ